MSTRSGGDSRWNEGRGSSVGVRCEAEGTRLRDLRAARARCTWRRTRNLWQDDARLIALDANTGALVSTFGDQGTVDLRKGLRIPPEGFADYQVTSPPAVVGNTIVVGSAIADGTNKPHPSGEVRGFDAITGKLRWSWDPFPQDPRALERPRDASARGPAARCMVRIVPIPPSIGVRSDQQPHHDYYVGEALRPVRRFRVSLRADPWARLALPEVPTTSGITTSPRAVLFDCRRTAHDRLGGRGSKRVILILDRETGKPLIPVEERPVPQTDVPGEVSAATQPFPTAPRSLAPTSLNAKDAWGVTEEDRAWCQKTMSTLRADGFFTPPSLKGTLVVPGNVGGMAWGGIAHDRVNDLLIMPVNNLAAEVRLIARDTVETGRKAGRLSGQFE